MRDAIAPAELAPKMSEIVENCVPRDGDEPQLAVKTFSPGPGRALHDL